MTWAIVQDSAQSVGTGTSNTFAFPSNVAAGNALLVLISENPSGGGTFIISDTQGNTWTPIFAPHANGTTGTLAGWGCVAKSSAASTVSLSWTTGSTFGGDIILAEFSGITGSFTLDGTAQIADVTTPSRNCTTPSYTPTVTGSLVVSIIQTGDAIASSSSPWINGDSYEYKAGSNLGAGNGGMPNTGSGWAWTTGATSAIPADATTVTSTAEFSSVIFGIKATGSSGTNATVTAVTMAGTGDLITPGVTAGTNASITSPTLAGTGDLVAPTVTGTIFALVAAPPLAATGDLIAPAVSTTTSITITAPTMAGTGDLVAPAVSTTGSAMITVTPLAGTGDLITPTVSATKNATVTATTLRGTGDLITPSVSNGTGTPHDYDRPITQAVQNITRSLTVQDPHSLAVQDNTGGQAVQSIAHTLTVQDPHSLAVKPDTKEQFVDG